MILDYKAESLDEVIRDFTNVSGIEMMVCDASFEPLFEREAPIFVNPYCARIHSFENGPKLCHNSDVKLLMAAARSKSPEYHLCHAGLIDIAIPIKDNEEILGYLILGQIRRWESFHGIDSLAKTLNAREGELRELYENLPLFDNNRINGIIHIATMLAKHILLTRLVKPRKLSNLEIVTEYIDKNLFEDLSVNKITEGTHLSKSLLYRLLGEHFGMTLCEYINKRRVREACELLSHTDFSIEKISSLSGFSGAAYFSRIFKNEVGMSPIKYRKSLTKI